MGRTLDVTELNFRADFGNVEIERELRLDDLLTFLPVDKGVELHLTRAGNQRNHLHDQ